MCVTGVPGAWCVGPACGGGVRGGAAHAGDGRHHRPAPAIRHHPPRHPEVRQYIRQQCVAYRVGVERPFRVQSGLCCWSLPD